MKPTQTGIAVTLAIVVVATFFIFPGLSPFGSVEPQATDQTLPTTTTTMPDATELQITDEIVGTGATAAKGDLVTAKYVGSFANGTVFDASANHPETVGGYTFPLGAGQVISGWDLGIVGMKEGGKRKLVIPPALGYGSQANGPIPANSTLIFEVELVKVQKN